MKFLATLTAIAISTTFSQSLKAQAIIWENLPLKERICYFSSNDNCADTTPPNTDIPEDVVPVDPNDSDKDSLDPQIKEELIYL